MMRIAAVLIFVFCLGVAADGMAVYVDAVGGAGGNTVRASDGSAAAWWTSATAEDGLWALRPDFANGGTVYESSGTGSGAEDSSMLRTTLSGLVPGGTYQVEVVYWSSNSQNWAIRAGLDSAGLSLYDRLGDGAVAGTATGASEADRVELLGSLGTVQADAGGRIHVYVDDKPSSSTQGGWYDRTWYDGVRYEVVDTGCNVPPLYDFSGPNGEPDCRVDFYDFVELASAWLECSLIPASACWE